MKKLYIIFLLVFFSAEIAFSQVAIEWQKSYGGSNEERGIDIIKTSDGGYLIGGYTESNNGDVSGNHGSYDYWVIKIDEFGNLSWQKCYGGTNWEFGYKIVETNNGYVITGTTNSPDGDVTGIHGWGDIWTVKIDYYGNIIWQRCYGGYYYDEAYSIETTADGGFIIAGYTGSNDGDITFNQGNEDCWVIKIDSIGNLQWQKTYGGYGFEEIQSIKQTIDGGYIFAAWTGSNSGDVSGNNGNNDGWIVKIDSVGNIVWQKCLGGPGADIGNFILLTGDGGFIVTLDAWASGGDVSFNYGSADYWVVKLDSIGNIQWEESYGGSQMDLVYSMIQTSDGGYLLTGNTISSDGLVTNHIDSADVWIVKIDSIGSLQWEKCLGGSSHDLGMTSLETSDGGFIVTGYSRSSDGDLTFNNGDMDIWIVKLTPEFNSISGKVFLDLNSNSIQDTGEQIISHHKISETNSGRLTISNNTGNYNLSVIDTGSFIVSPDALLYYNSQPNQYNINFNNMMLIDSLNNFALQPNGTINDLKISISPLNAFRPGFDAHYNINFKNIGTTNHSGTIIFYPDTNLNFVSSSITPVTITPDSIIWSTNTLSPFDDGNIILTFNVYSSTPNGTIVTSTSKIEPFTLDADITNNTATWDVTVTGSFDPNDILVSRETVLTTELSNPPYLEYLIRFQNTGTDTAFTVKIKNPIPVNTNFTTFIFVESSHTVQLNYNNAENVMWFNFVNILQPDSNTNELLSHGFIRYRIKPVTNLIVGDSILNSASIFFDFNAPVITNTAVTEIVLPISIPEIQDNFNLSLFPNPTNGELNASFTLRNDVTVEMHVFNNLGQIVKTISGKKMKAGNNKITFSTENMHPGIYHLQLLIDGEAITRKLVKM